MPKGVKDGKRTIRKGAGLLVSQRRGLEDDIFEDDEDDTNADYREKRLDEDAGFDDSLPEGFEDEEIDSEEEELDDEDILPSSLRNKKGAAGNKKKHTQSYDEDDEDEEDELGSSADEEDYTDLSKMLDDNSDEEAEAPNKGASDRMLHAAGLRQKKPRERTEARDEDDFASSGGGLTVDKLIGALGNAEGFGQTKRDLASLSKVAGHNSSRAQLLAPLEKVEQRRIERQAATAAAHEDVALWQNAVQKNRDSEQLRFPLDRPTKAAANSSTSALTSTFKPSSELEKGVEALLEEHGLSEAAMAKGEELELSNISEAEVAKRTAELRKMRDLLFHHERRLKRASKIKSKSYRRVHKKAKAARAEAEAQLAALDKQTAQRIQLKREVDRVRERMTLKHKNTSRWAKNALKQQQKNPALRLAVAEQLARGEELRRKQEDANAGRRGGKTERGGGGRKTASGLLSMVRQEEDPALPDKGVLSMGFMKRAVERQRAEAAAVLKQLEEEAREAEAAADAAEAEDESGEEEEAAPKVRGGQARRSGAAGAGPGKKGSGAREDDEDDDLDEDEEEEGDYGEMVRLEKQEKRAAQSAKTAASAKRDALRRDSGGGRRVLGADGGAAVGGVAEGEKPLKRKKLREMAAAAAAAAAGSASRGVMGACSSDGPITVAGGEKLLTAMASEAAKEAAGGNQGEKGKQGKKRKQAAEESEEAVADAAGSTSGESWLRGSGSGGAEWLTASPADAAAAVPQNFGNGSSRFAPQPPLASHRHGPLQRLIDEAFPESAAADFAREKAKFAEHEAPKGEESTDLPGWGSWSGLGAKPNRWAEERKVSAAEARKAIVEAAAARRKDAALRNVIVSEKRDKKAAQFTTAGVPFPFSSREQFERSLRAPIGKEWNTAASHKAMTAPAITTVKGALIAPIGMHNKAEPGQKKVQKSQRAK